MTMAIFTKDIDFRVEGRTVAIHQEPRVAVQDRLAVRDPDLPRGRPECGGCEARWLVDPYWRLFAGDTPPDNLSDAVALSRQKGYSGW